MESSLKKLDQQEAKYTDELNAALAQYADLQQQATNMDAVELDIARQVVRPDKEREAVQQLQATYGKRFNSEMLAQSQKDVAGLLGEVTKPLSIREKLRQSHEQQDKQRHKHERDQER